MSRRLNFTARFPSTPGGVTYHVLSAEAVRGRYLTPATHADSTRAPGHAGAGCGCGRWISDGMYGYTSGFRLAGAPSRGFQRIRPIEYPGPGGDPTRPSGTGRPLPSIAEGASGAGGLVGFVLPCHVYGRPPECDNCGPGDECYGVLVGLPGARAIDGAVVRFCAPAGQDPNDGRSQAWLTARGYCSFWSGFPDPVHGPAIRGGGVCPLARAMSERETQRYLQSQGINQVRCYDEMPLDAVCAQSVATWIAQIRTGIPPHRLTTPTCGIERHIRDLIFRGLYRDDFTLLPVPAPFL